MWRACRNLCSSHIEAADLVLLIILNARSIEISMITEINLGLNDATVFTNPLGFQRRRDRERRLFAGKLPIHKTSLLRMGRDLPCNGEHNIKAETLEVALVLDNR